MVVFLHPLMLQYFGLTSQLCCRIIKCNQIEILPIHLLSKISNNRILDFFVFFYKDKNKKLSKKIY